MKDIEQIQAVVARAVARRRSLRAWSQGWQGLLIGGLLWLLIAGIWLLFPVSPQVLYGSLVLPVGGGFVGAWLGWSRKPDASATASWLDRKAGLQNSLGTALEWSSDPQRESSPWTQLVCREGARHAETLKPESLMPFQVPQLSRWILMVFALGAGLGFVPEYRSQEQVNQEKEEAVMRESGQTLESLMKRSLEQRPRSNNPTGEQLADIQSLGMELQEGRLTKAGALERLAEVNRETRKLAENLGTQEAVRRMASMNRGASGSPPSQQEMMEALRKSLPDPRPTGEDLQELKDQLESMKKQAEASRQQGTGKETSDSPSPQGLPNASQLSKALNRAAEMGLSMPDLQSALQALESMDADLFLSELNQAMEQLDALADLAQQLSKMESQAVREDAPLGERLEAGQGQRSLERLQEMMKELQKSASGKTPDPQAMEDLIRELKDAVKPGSSYGEVGEKLQEAAQALKQGDSQGAAQSLDEAADEIQKLMEQAADLESMKQAMEALRRASYSISTGNGWGQCPNPSSSSAPGKGIGRGVGTWAQESGWVPNPEQLQSWDNSGIERPDMDPRGTTDRAVTEVDERFRPDKLSGTFNPGASMPSVTLKGVSIKGQSRVTYEQARQAAQEEAENSLSEDKVPRAYQGAVKQYFETLP